MHLWHQACIMVFLLWWGRDSHMSLCLICFHVSSCYHLSKRYCQEMGTEYDVFFSTRQKFVAFPEVLIEIEGRGNNGTWLWLETLGGIQCSNTQAALIWQSILWNSALVLCTFWSQGIQHLRTWRIKLQLIIESYLCVIMSKTILEFQTKPGVYWDLLLSC